MAGTRSATKQLSALLAACPSPIYLVDDRRRIVYCNEACGNWLGRQCQELVGKRCDYHAGGEDEAAALCPPPEVFLGQSAEAVLVWTDAAGSVTERPATFVPLGNQVDCVGVLAVVATGDPAPPAEAGSPAKELASPELHRRLQLYVRRHASSFRLDQLVGESAAMRRVRAQVAIAVQTSSRITVVGPPGSGRERVARTIHSGRQSPPLMPLACPVLDAELLQTTTLAFLRRCRDSEATSTGTILLLEGDQLPAAAQAELLAFFRVPTFDLRTIATVRRPLVDLASEGLFDRELALELSTLVIELPALAERREDIPLLAQQLVENFNARGDRQISGLTPEVLDRLGAMPWGQNLDELSEVVDQACRRASGVWIQEADLPERVQLLEAAAAHPAPPPETIQLDEFLGDVERELIRRAIRRTRGNKARAARLLGIQRGRLLRRLTQLGLDEAT